MTIEKTKEDYLFEIPKAELVDEKSLKPMVEDAILQLKVMDEPFALGFIDIDDFKEFNIQFGNEFGDLVLKKFVEILRRDLRYRDRLARIGGDQFIMLLREVEDLADITSLSKGWLRNSNHGWNLDGKSITLKFSAGFIFVKDVEATAQEIYDLANSQMEKVKKQGKNGCSSAVLHGPINW